MRKLKRLVPMLALLIAGLWIATQWAARQMAYVPEACCWVRTADWTLYAPWALLRWDAHDPTMDGRAVRNATAAFFLYAVVAIGMAALLVRGNGATPAKSFGVGGWGTRRDMKRAGLLSACGTVVGLNGDELLTYDGPEHQLVSGASRSGKGVGHVIPTLLCCQGSILAYDVKGELWKNTAGYRARTGDRCLPFNPIRPDASVLTATSSAATPISHHGATEANEDYGKAGEL